MLRIKSSYWTLKFCWRNHFSYLKKCLGESASFLKDALLFHNSPPSFYVLRIWHKRLWKEAKKYGKYLLSTLRERELFSQMGNTIRCTTFATLSLVLCWCHIMYESHFQKRWIWRQNISLLSQNSSCLPPNITHILR